MIWHIVDGEQLLTLPRDDAGHVLLQLIVVFLPKQVLPALNSKNNIDLNLCVGVSHDMPLLRSLPQSGVRVTIKILLLRSIIPIFQPSKLRGRARAQRASLPSPVVKRQSEDAAPTLPPGAAKEGRRIL